MCEPWPGHFKLPIISLVVVRNIKCGYSFSRYFLFCNKTASSTETPFTMLISATLQAKKPEKFDFICLNDDHDPFEHSNCLQPQPSCERFVASAHRVVLFGTSRNMVRKYKNNVWYNKMALSPSPVPDP